MIRTDDLGYKGLVLLQDDTLDRFSADAVWLANFLRAAPGERVIDLGAGGGVIAVLGEAKTGASFVGVEKQSALCTLARRSAEMNGQDIPFHCMDVADAPAILGHGVFSAAVMNPPYFRAGEEGGNASRAAARHDTEGVLEMFLASAFLLLKNGGRLYGCYPAAQLVDLVCALRAARLEPKRLRPVASAAERAPTRVLFEAKKLGRPGLVWERTTFGLEALDERCENGDFDAWKVKKSPSRKRE